MNPKKPAKCMDYQEEKPPGSYVWWKGFKVCKPCWERRAGMKWPPPLESALSQPR